MAEIGTFQAFNSTIPADDFTFVAIKTNNDFIYQYLHDAEKKLLQDPKSALTVFRNSFERIGIYEKAWEQKKYLDRNSVTDPDLTEEELDQANLANKDIQRMRDNRRKDNREKTPSSGEPFQHYSDAKSLVSRFLYRKQETHFDDAYPFPERLLPYASVGTRDHSADGTKLNNLPFFLYSIFSELGSHAGTRLSEHELVDLAKLTAQQMLILCNILFQDISPEEACRSSDLRHIPIGDYLFVPDENLPEITIPTGEHLYVKIENDVTQGFFLAREGVSPDNPYALHDREAIKSIGELKNRVPEGCPQYVGTIGEGNQAIAFFTLPGEPTGLTNHSLSSLTQKQRIDAAGSLIRTIYEMHRGAIPFAHRSLRPEILLLCKRGYSNALIYKIVIANFDSVKYEDDRIDSPITTYGAVQITSPEYLNYLAPECRDSHNPTVDMHDITNACRADIYSLGKLLAFILPDSFNEPESKMHALIGSMCQEDPAKRPSISYVKEIFEECCLPLQLKYSYCLLRGDRENLEDVVFTDQKVTQTETRVKMEALQGSAHLFGVTDGIGGAVDGERAAERTAVLLSSRLSALLSADSKELPSDEALQKAAEYADAGVASMLREDGVRKGGAAFAVVLIQDQKLVSINVGDCRVYLLNKSGCRKLSTDDRSKWQNNELTQFAGIQRLMPDICVKAHIQREDLSAGDMVLVCSDGVTDAICETDLAAAVHRENASSEMENFLYASISKNATDNAGAVLVSLEREVLE